MTVGAPLAEKMLLTTVLSWLLSALFTFGSAGAAIAVGKLSERGGQAQPSGCAHRHSR